MNRKIRNWTIGITVPLAVFAAGAGVGLLSATPAGEYVTNAARYLAGIIFYDSSLARLPKRCGPYELIYASDKPKLDPLEANPEWNKLVARAAGDLLKGEKNVDPEVTACVEMAIGNYNGLYYPSIRHIPTLVKPQKPKPAKTQKRYRA